MTSLANAIQREGHREGHGTESQHSITVSLTLSSWLFNRLIPPSPHQRSAGSGLSQHRGCEHVIPTPRLIRSHCVCAISHSRNIYTMRIGRCYKAESSSPAPQELSVSHLTPHHLDLLAAPLSDSPSFPRWASDHVKLGVVWLQEPPARSQSRSRAAEVKTCGLRGTNHQCFG